MRFLIDTNVLIGSEPTRASEVEAATAACLELARLASGEHHLLVHPTASDEIRHDRDEERQRLRQQVVQRYETLANAPTIQTRLISELGHAAPGSHDWYDHQLLAAVESNAVHGLVTQDDGIHRKARRLGLDDRVYYLTDAIAVLESLSRRPPDFIPSVDYVPLHSLDVADPFFDSLKADYEGFETWFRDKQAEGREAFVVTGPSGELAGVCALKPGDNEIGVGGHVTKITTLKVADQFKGNRYGELLLKAMFRHVHHNGDDALWVTVFPKHEELIDLLGSFGFSDAGPHPGTGERRFLKRLRQDAAEMLPLDALAFHITFGPPAIQITQDQTFIIPIRPEYHESLFPDAPTAPEPQLPLPGLEVPTPARPHGNALRKAYLCHAAVRSMRPGATLLFYRSVDLMAVTTIGVLEAQLVSSDPVDLLDFVGTRTVYSSDEVVAMAAEKPVLALRFRQDRFLEPPLTIDELKDAEAVRRAPQTIHRVQQEAIPWLIAQLDA